MRQIPFMLHQLLQRVSSLGAIAHALSRLLNPLSTVNFWRNIMAASFPLFAIQVYKNLGIRGAGSLVAGIATALAPLPFIAFYFGSSLRARSDARRARNMHS